MLDPFCGAGRALAVAVEHGRRAIGFETDEAFAAAARQSVADVGAGSRRLPKMQWPAVAEQSGMFDTLEARIAQARAGELGHLQFLQSALRRRT